VLLWCWRHLNEERQLHQNMERAPPYLTVMLRFLPSLKGWVSTEVSL
jgi:hypothetical protein